MGVGWTSGKIRVPGMSRPVGWTALAHGVIARSLGCGMPCVGAGSRPSLAQATHLSLDTNDCRARLDLACLWLDGAHAGVGVAKECYLVDPASSHMLVSKIKPCMCKYELIQTVKLRMAH